MAQIKLTEGELRTIIRKVITEGFNDVNTYTVEIKCETEEGIPFGLTAKVDISENSVDEQTIELIPNSYDPNNGREILNWISQNLNNIEDEFVSQALIDSEQNFDQAHEFDPERFMESITEETIQNKIYNGVIGSNLSFDEKKNSTKHLK